MKNNLKSIRKFTLIVLLSGLNSLWPGNSSAQRSLFNIGYAHNDYLQKRPLFDALENGFTQVEADIFLQNDALIVAHWFPFFKSQTLEQLYLAPLKKYLASSENRSLSVGNPFTLVIDIKSSPAETYDALNVLLERYRPILSHYKEGVFYPGIVNIVLTGRKPTAAIARQSSRLVMLDDQLDELSDLPDSNLFAMASCNYKNVLKWTGNGHLPTEEKSRLIKMVSAAHEHGKKVRLWACPENTAVWNALLDCGVDYINTDQLTKMRAFIESRFRSLQFQAQIKE